MHCEDKNRIMLCLYGLHNRTEINCSSVLFESPMDALLATTTVDCCLYVKLSTTSQVHSAETLYWTLNKVRCSHFLIFSDISVVFCLDEICYISTPSLYNHIT
jgi:hypothetical protein